MVEKLADEYGEPVSLDGVERRSFPTPVRLAKVGVAELRRVVVMWRRAACISKVAKDVEKGCLKLDALAGMPYGEAKERLVKYKGIGPKIADCVLLFSLDKPEAFPIDTNIRQGLLKQYGGRGFPDRKPPTHRKNLQWAQEHFGRNAGYASQFLFQDMGPDSD